MIDDSERYLNRELSLLDFQERVLALAGDDRLPLLERVKFLAIVSHNIDEFFQVRVAGLLNQVAGDIAVTSPDGLTASQQLQHIEAKARALTTRIDELFMEQLLPTLEKERIRVAGADHQLTPADREYLAELFEDEIFPVLTPLAVDPSHPFPYISDLSLSLSVLLKSPDRETLQFARVKVPPILPRFVALPDGETLVPLEQVIAAHLDRLFGGQLVVEHSFFRVTRNADYAVEEQEAHDLLEAMEAALQFRKRSAAAVRLELGPGVTDQVERLLMRELGVDGSQIYRRTAPLDLNGLWALYGLDRPDLKEEPWVPTTQPRLADTDNVDFFAEIGAGDLLVHHPYESFTTSTGAFLAQAVSDPDVLAIKQTLYRTSVSEDPAIGGERGVVDLLIAAAEAGKQVVVLVELKARFDEAANIDWARMLENAGAHVVYGVAGLKTHSKILLVVRREGTALKRYCHIGTGNYNPNTARIYEDMGLLTADKKIGSDLSEVFNRLTGYASTDTYRRLLVAPETLRTRMTDLIRREGDLGAEGDIVMKINHLVDPQIIDELYAASQQGCRIRLIVRGMCSLRAGVAGLSDTITVRSIVGRFLEHSRIYRFGASKPDYYLGSADMMQRNLQGRVEVLTPVRDPQLRARLDEVLDTLFTDDRLAWQLDPDGSWTRVPRDGGVDAHERLQQLAIERSQEAFAQWPG